MACHAPKKNLIVFMDVVRISGGTARYSGLNLQDGIGPLGRYTAWSSNASSSFKMTPAFGTDRRAVAVSQIAVSADRPGRPGAQGPLCRPEVTHRNGLSFPMTHGHRSIPAFRPAASTAQPALQRGEQPPNRTREPHPPLHSSHGLGREKLPYNGGSSSNNTFHSDYRRPLTAKTTRLGRFGRAADGRPECPVPPQIQSPPWSADRPD